MADEDISINITANDEASAKIRAVGESAKKAGEAGKLGFFALGEAAENAAQSLGVPNQVSRQLGNSVERMSASLGMAGIALGAVGLAATSAVLIWRKYREEQEKIREEKIKAGQAAAAWITGILAETANTRELVAAKQEMARAEFEINKARAEAAVPELLAKQAELQAKYTLEQKRANGEAFIWIGSWEDAKKKAEGFRLELGMVNAQVQANNAALKLYTDANKDRIGSGGKGFDTTASDLEWQNMIAFSQAHMKYEAEALEASRQYTADQAMLTQARIDDANRERDAKREAFYNTAGFLSSSFQAMYQAGGAHARKNFSLFKIAASAEALINADRAAASAFAWGTQLGGPGLGGALAALAFAAGMARVKSIRAMTLEGGGGAGGSIPTYTTSPTTGETSGSPVVNLKLIVNGVEKGITELTGQVVSELGRNSGSIGGWDIMMSRTA